MNATPDTAPLVEREQLLADLVAAIGDGTDAIVLRGPQGVGRTRLCLELAGRAHDAGHSVTVLRGGVGQRRNRPGTRAARPVLVVDDAERVAAMPRQAKRTVVVTTVRTDRAAPPPTAPATDPAVFDIEPLTFDGTEHLLASWLGGPVLSTVVARAHQASGGRPLWLREWVDAARQHGDLSREDGLWVCARDPRPTTRTGELALWATAELGDAERDALRLLGAWGAVPAGRRDGSAWSTLEEHGWIGRDGDDVVATVPLLAAALCDGSEPPRPVDRLGRTATRSGPTSHAHDAGLQRTLDALLAGTPARAAADARSRRRDVVADPERTADAALSLGLVELWAGRADAARWFAEAAQLAPPSSPAALAGRAMARSRAAIPATEAGGLGLGDDALDALAVLELGTMPGADPWLVNPVRARAWLLAANGDPAALRVLDEGARDAADHGRPLMATILTIDAVLLDPSPARALAATAELEPIEGAWAPALQLVVDALADHKASPSTRAAALVVGGEELERIGDRRVALEAYRLAGNLARTSGREREGAELHERADAIAGADGVRSWVRDLPAAVLALPPRQRQIVVMAGDGQSNQAIADRLSVSLRTVENQLHRAFAELHVGGRTELARLLHPPS
jgi:DNA-binding CsgD family transcriptional regulator